MVCSTASALTSTPTLVDETGRIYVCRDSCALKGGFVCRESVQACRAGKHHSGKLTLQTKMVHRGRDKPHSETSAFSGKCDGSDLGLKPLRSG